MSITCSIASCEKYSFDYRTKFQGTFNIDEHVVSYNPVDGGKDTTYQYTVSVSLDDSQKNQLFINSIIVIVFEDGTLKGNYNNNGYGEFSTSDSFVYSYGFQSASSHSFHSIKAERK